MKNKKYTHILSTIFIYGTDLVDMQLKSKHNKGFQFLLWIIDIYTNMHGLCLKKTKKVLQLLMLFKKFLNESGCKPVKIWVDKGSKFIKHK